MALILVADDDPDALDLLCFALQSAGHDVIAAGDAAAALTAAAGRDLDLIVTDFHMPGMTGAQLVERHRLVSKGFAVPAIVVTAAARREAVPEGIFVRWVDKPFSIRSLRAEVDQVLAAGLTPTRDSSGSRPAFHQQELTPRSVRQRRLSRQSSPGPGLARPRYDAAVNPHRAGRRTTRTIRSGALLIAEIDCTYEQPLPWNAPEVHVLLHDGREFTCQVSRCPGDLLFVRAGGRPLPVGTRVEVQWTQQDRGGYAAGTVIAPPESEPPGVYIRIDESVTGVERRFGCRLPARVAARVLSPSGPALTGHTTDLSRSGAHIVADPVSCGDGLLTFLPDVSEKGGGEPITVELALPAGSVRLVCRLVGGVPDTSGVRVRFMNDDESAIAQIEAFLDAEQRRIALLTS
ncbi:response regulator [Actinoplanes sp. NPDC020271]|uniref:response regulator n=1 Tax=Actinoplanes sp. NPDC020271 TaxID=3363896 RepID=UPI00379EB3DC